MKEIEILHQILYYSKYFFFFSKFASRCLERSSAHWVKSTYTKLRGFLVCCKTFLGVLKVLTNNTYFRQQYDFPLNVFIILPILI